MSQAKASPIAIQQFQSGSVDSIGLGRERVSEATLYAKRTAIFWLGSAGLLIPLCVVLLLNIFVAVAFAQGREQASGIVTLAARGTPEGTASAFDPAPLPQSDITAFHRSGVPAGMRGALS